MKTKYINNIDVICNNFHKISFDSRLSLWPLGYFLGRISIGTFPNEDMLSPAWISMVIEIIVILVMIVMLATKFVKTI